MPIIIFNSYLLWQYPLQYSGLENSTDCTVHGVTMIASFAIILLFNLTPRFLTKKYETLCSHTYKMYANVYISFIHSCQNPEINEVSFNLQMSKQSTMQSFSELLLGNEKEWPIDSHGHEWLSNAFCWIKEDSHKILHIVWFYRMTF